MDFDKAIDWCLTYNVEIEPDTALNTSKNRGTSCIQYCYFNKSIQEYVRVVKTADTLVEAVEKMIKEIGEVPEVGIFVK